MQRSKYRRPACTCGAYILSIFAFTLSGCGTNQQKIQDNVDAGQVALGGNRYEAAIDAADRALEIGPSAQAYYIRARAEEDRPKPDNNITEADLQKAKNDYQSALNLDPPPALAARCRVGLANFAFAHEDYAGAITNWTSAVDGLDQPQWRAMALFRMGQAQQRLGQFDAANKTFQRIRDDYPDQDIASRAKDLQDVRAYYVQVGTYTNIDDAETAVKKATGAGVTCRQVSDQGLIAVRGGPYADYAEARKAQDALNGLFPAVVIKP